MKETCPSCGAEHCRSHGTCPRCGGVTVVLPGDEVCTSCGEDIITDPTLHYNERCAATGVAWGFHSYGIVGFRKIPLLFAPIRTGFETAVAESHAPPTEDMRLLLATDDDKCQLMIGSLIALMAVVPDSSFSITLSIDNILDGSPNITKLAFQPQPLFKHSETGRWYTLARNTYYSTKHHVAFSISMLPSGEPTPSITFSTRINKKDLLAAPILLLIHLCRSMKSSLDHPIELLRYLVEYTRTKQWRPGSTSASTALLSIISYDSNST